MTEKNPTAEATAAVPREDKSGSSCQILNVTLMRLGGGRVLTSERLELRPVSTADLEAFQRGMAALAEHLGVSVPEGWPTFPEAFSFGANGHVGDAPLRYPALFFIDRAAGTLVGNGGFTGPPDREGNVELGYEIAPAFRNRGFASEAVGAMVAHAFSDEVVSAVVAHTLAEENASVRVLRKVGLRRVGEFPDAEVGTVWRWEIRRDGLEDSARRVGAIPSS